MELLVLDDIETDYIIIRWENIGEANGSVVHLGDYLASSAKFLPAHDLGSGSTSDGDWGHDCIHSDVSFYEPVIYSDSDNDWDHDVILSDSGDDENSATHSVSNLDYDGSCVDDPVVADLDYHNATGAVDSSRTSMMTGRKHLLTQVSTLFTMTTRTTTTLAPRAVLPTTTLWSATLRLIIPIWKALKMIRSCSSPECITS